VGVLKSRAPAGSQSGERFETLIGSISIIACKARSLCPEYESPPTFPIPTMSTAIDGGKFSISQLLRAAKRNLQAIAFGGQFV